MQYLTGRASRSKGAGAAGCRWPSRQRCCHEGHLRSSPACKPGSVGCNAPGRSFLWGCGHPHPLAAYPRRLDRGGHLSPPIWPCSDWGLPCRACRQTRGGLLPHLFTLTCDTLQAVCFLWHFPSRCRAQALPGSLPNGARTFLEAYRCPATIRPASLQKDNRNLARSQPALSFRVPDPHAVIPGPPWRRGIYPVPKRSAFLRVNPRFPLFARPATWHVRRSKS